MEIISSEEIQSQYNLIKMLLTEPESYGVAINAIKKNIAYMPIELKERLKEENIFLWMKRNENLSWSVIFKN